MTTPPKPTFTSEELEPFAALIMGRMFARVQWEQEHGDQWGVESECARLWWAAQAIEKLSCAIPDATHFSIASSNNLRGAADIVECITGVRPSYT